MSGDLIQGEAPTATSGGSEGTRGSYTIGFGLSLLLTALPFFIVIREVFPVTLRVVAVVASAVAQILVQIVIFMHLSRSSSQRWNLAAVVYVLVILLIVAGGSIWIMYHLDYNMMPQMPQTEQLP